jgi:ABC-2 type transport system permease protein
MTVDVVAKKDLADGIRSKLLLSLIALFVLAMGGIAHFTTDGLSANGPQELLVLAVLGSLGPVIILVPITGLVVSIKSIVRERELGSLNLLLSLPHTRGEVFFGKFIGRTGLLTVSIIAGFIPAGLLFFTRTSGFPVGGYLAFMIMSILFGATFVAIGVSLSAFVSTETRATIGGIVAFLLLYLWNTIFAFVNNELGLLATDSDLFLLIQRIQLQTVFIDGIFALASFRFDDIPSASTVVPEYGAAAADSSELAIPAQPFFLQHWFAFVILALWIAVPLVIGYLRFNSVDL